MGGKNWHALKGEGDRVQEYRGKGEWKGKKWEREV
jgi:hypothetical protein